MVRRVGPKNAAPQKGLKEGERREDMKLDDERVGSVMFT